MKSAKPPQKAVTGFRLTRTVAERRIHAIAKDSDGIIFSNHALERMYQRGIDDIQVLEILRTGMVIDDPTLTERNEWKCKIVKKLKGGREAGVITIILHSGRLFIKTTEWEDLR